MQLYFPSISQALLTLYKKWPLKQGCSSINNLPERVNSGAETGKGHAPETRPINPIRVVVKIMAPFWVP